MYEWSAYAEGFATFVKPLLERRKKHEADEHSTLNAALLR